MGNNTGLPVCKMYVNQSVASESVKEEGTTAIPFLPPDPKLNNLTLNTTDVPNADHNGGMSIGWLGVVISILCVLGIVGNILNLLVLSSRRMSSDRIGRSMNVGLVSLAISDMMFCIVVFPYTFVPKDMEPTPGDASIFKLIYRIYGVACINVFMMSSTWIVMFMSVSRYLGVVYPLKAKSSICTQKMPIIVLFVYIVSILVTLPYFIHLSVLPCTDASGTHTLYELRSLFKTDTGDKLVYYIRWVWPVIADFFPLLLLVFCNSKLIMELHKTSKSRKETCPGQPVRATSNRVTVTLIAVVVMLFVFVSPAEILKYINPYKSWGAVGHVVAMVTNVMQLVNFASNFLLYCAINPKFRAAAKGLVFDLCCPWKAKAKHRLISDRSTDQSTRTTAVGQWKSTYSSRSNRGGVLGSYQQISTAAVSQM